MNMKLVVLARSLFCPLAAATFLANPALAQEDEIDYVLGQWEFDGDLSAETGQAIEYFGAIEGGTEFVTEMINGQEAQVMQFPQAAPGEGYKVFHGAPANGGGTNVNEYTITMDIKYPEGNRWRAILKTREDGGDADLFVADEFFGEGIGINGLYDGVIVPGQWHRVALSFNLNTTNSVLAKYIDGQLVGEQTLTAEVDGRWSLEPSFLLFADNDGETAPGLINSLQFRDYAMTAEEIEALGLPSAAGITTPGVPPAGDFRLSIAKSGNSVRITVDQAGNYQLVKSPTVNGTYAPEGARQNTQEFTVPIEPGANAFFRVYR